MRSFLKKVSVFFILTLLFIAGLIILSDFALKQRKSDLLRISDDIHIVFSGDSYVECAVNENLIANSINIAQAGEAYLYSYAKIKSLLEYNDQINAVFIGFSFGDVLMEKEERWLLPTGDHTR